MRCNRVIEFGWFTFLVCGPALALGDTFTVGPSADAFVTSANPDNNYGGAGAVAVSASEMSKGGFRALLQFDLAGAKASFDATFGAGNWLLDAASLQLTAAFPNNALFNASGAGEIDVTWMDDDSWSEGAGTPMAPGGTGITWNTLPNFLSAGEESLGGIGFDGATAGTDVYPLLISTGLSGDAVAGSLASILLSPADSTVSALFNSRTFNNAASRPVLTLTAVAIPEPSGCLLACVGVATASVVGLKRFTC